MQVRQTDVEDDDDDDHHHDDDDGVDVDVEKYRRCG
jgi:hypothetical protein